MPNNKNASSALWTGIYILQSDQAVIFEVNAVADVGLSPRLAANLPIEIMMQD
jgi:hypothetical protein